MTTTTTRRSSMQAVPNPNPIPDLCEVMLLPVADLFVPSTYQRPLEPLRVEKIAGEFDRNEFHPLVVIAAGGGRWEVNDGQHRYHAAVILGITHVWCMIAKTDAPGELFVAAQRNRKALTPFDQHRALLYDREPQSLRLEAFLRQYGLRVGANAKNRGTVNGISMFYRLLYGPASKIGSVTADAEPHVVSLEWSLGVIRDVWGSEHSDSASRGSIMVEALAEFHAGLGDAIKYQRVTESLTQIEPKTIITRARSRPDRGFRGSHSVLVAQQVAEQYNAGRGGLRKLEIMKIAGFKR